jgi:uncharacterized membrane protein
MTWIIENAPHDSLWYDETVNAYLATSSWKTIWHWTTAIDNQVPLHFVTLKLWIPFLGSSEFSLRLFSMFSALLATAGVIALGKRLWEGNGYQVGWIAAILLAGSGAFLYAAGEVRTYALALTLLVWSSVFLWELWQEPTHIRPSLLIPYLILTILLVHTHYTAWFGVAAQFALMGMRLCSNRFQGKQLLSMITLGLIVGAAPWIVALRGRNFNAGTAFEGSVEPQEAIETYLNFYVFGQKLFSDQTTQIGIVVGVLAGIGLILWSVRGIKLPRQWTSVGFVGVLGLTPLIVLTVAVYEIEGKLSGRHTWVMWVAMALGLAGGIQALFEWLSHSRWRWGLFGIVFLLPLLTYIEGKTLKDQYVGDFRGAFAILQAETGTNDILILRDGTLFTAAEFYQSPIPYVGIPQDQLTDVNHQVDMREAWSVLETMLSDDVGRIWVLSWQGDTMDPTGLAFALPEYLSDGQRQVWIGPSDDAETNVVGLVSYQVVGKVVPIQEHIISLPDVLQVPPDGPSLLGSEVFTILPSDKTRHNECGIIVHTWWWRGETDYPHTMLSVRLVNSAGERLIQRDLPPAGYRFGQEKWIPFVPTLGRIFLPYGCDHFKAGANYQVEMVVYDSAGEKPEQPVLLDTFSIRN